MDEYTSVSNCDKRAQLTLYKHYPPDSHAISHAILRLKCMFKLS